MNIRFGPADRALVATGPASALADMADIVDDAASRLRGVEGLDLGRPALAPLPDPVQASMYDEATRGLEDAIAGTSLLDGAAGYEIQVAESASVALGSLATLARHRQVTVGAADATIDQLGDIATQLRGHALMSSDVDGGSPAWRRIEDAMEAYHERMEHRNATIGDAAQARFHDYFGTEARWNELLGEELAAAGERSMRREGMART